MDLASRERAQLAPRRVFYGWYIVGAGAFSNFVVIGIALLGFGVFIEPIHQELGWSMSAIGLGFSIRSFETGLLSPFTGYLIDRIGPRRMTIMGIIVLAVGLLLLSQAHSLRAYYAASVAIALGQALGSLNTYSVAIMSWFRKKRGRAMGLLNAGNGSGYAATIVLAVLLGAYGWRGTMVITAAAVLAIGLPMALVLRHRPEPYGYLPDGESPSASVPAPDPPGRQAQPSARAGASATGMSVREALHVPAFYLLGLAIAAGGIAQMTWVTFQIPHLQTAGFSVGVAGIVVAVYGGIQVALRVAIGWLGDAIGRQRVYIASYLLQAVGLVIFANLSPSLVWLLPLYYLTFALGHAAWVIGIQTVVADYFGIRRFATLRGLLMMPMTATGVVGPYFAGLMYDQTGSYERAFVVLAVVCGTGALWVALVRRPQWGAS